MEIVDPPGRSSREPSEHWQTVVRTLKDDYPGRYAKVGDYSNGVGTQIRKGLYPAFIPAGVTDKADYMERHWVVTTRRSHSDRRDLYIKWVGDDCTCRYCV